MKRPVEHQTKGGTLIIPDGFFVRHVDLDIDPPICIIQNDEYPATEKTLEIPRSLAYFLSVHHNGSEEFREILRTDAQNELRNKINSLLTIQERAPR
jgi:hypothetical protein